MEREGDRHASARLVGHARYPLCSCHEPDTGEAGVGCAAARSSGRVDLVGGRQDGRQRGSSSQCLVRSVGMPRWPRGIVVGWRATRAAEYRKLPRCGQDLEVILRDRTARAWGYSSVRAGAACPGSCPRVGRCVGTGVIRRSPMFVWTCGTSVWRRHAQRLCTRELSCRLAGF